MKETRIDLIHRALNTCLEAEKFFIDTEMLFGPNIKESNLYRAISKPLDEMVDAVSVAVCDDQQWLHWYIASGYGKKPIVAKGREIRTVDDLIWLIDECGKKENSDGR